MNPVRIAVIGAGAFGANHLRVLHELPGANLTAVVDTNPERAAAAAAQYGCPVFQNYLELIGKVDAAVIATPTVTHAEIGCALLKNGIDVLVEKPIAHDLESAARLISVSAGRVLQVGHLERFNPAIQALTRVITLPLFFEIHRLNLFSPRSLDVDVVLDLMIHDVDILLSLTGRPPEEIRAAGVAILSRKTDIANVRLSFAGGCIANLTASRVSTERVRKLRLFQPHQYISLDYQRQDGAVFSVSPENEIAYAPLDSVKAEPLRLQAEHFLTCVRERTVPLVNGSAATEALRVSLAILAKIEEHLDLVHNSIEQWQATSLPSVSSVQYPE